MESPESAKLRTQTRNQQRLHYASDKNLPRKKSLQEDLLMPSHMRVNSKFEFVNEEVGGQRANGLSIFNNNFLTLLPTQSVALAPTTRTDSAQLQAPITTRNNEPRRSDFKIRRKELQIFLSPDKGRHSLHNIESLLPKRKDLNVFKNVL